MEGGRSRFSLGDITSVHQCKPDGFSPELLLNLVWRYQMDRTSIRDICSRCDLYFDVKFAELGEHKVKVLLRGMLAFLPRYREVRT